MAMDANTGESPGHQSQSQKLGNSPSEEAMGHWTPTGIEPMDQGAVMIMGKIFFFFLKMAGVEKVVTAYKKQCYTFLA